MKQKLFTDSEYKKIISIARDVAENDDQILLFIKKCEEFRSQALVLDAILTGSVKVVGFTKDDFIIQRV